MVTFEEFRKISGCQICGSRLIAEVDGKVNIDVGTFKGGAFILAPEGERIVARYEGKKEEEVNQIVAEAEERERAKTALEDTMPVYKGKAKS